MQPAGFGIADTASATDVSQFATVRRRITFLAVVEPILIGIHFAYSSAYVPDRQQDRDL